MTGRLVVTWSRSPDDGPDHVAGVVAEVAGVSPQDIAIVHACRACGSDTHGQPQVLWSGRTLHVSISRSGGLTVVAVTDVGPVGVDVESLALATPDDLVAWVRTEALVKATGHGLTIDPDLIEAGPTWSVDLDAPEGFVAAVTVLTDTGPPRVVSGWAAPAG